MRASHARSRADRWRLLTRRRRMHPLSTARPQPGSRSAQSHGSSIPPANRSALRLFAPAREFRERFGRGRIDAEDRAALLHLLLHEILEQRLLERLRCDLLGDVLRNDGDAFTVANDDVAGIN